MRTNFIRLLAYGMVLESLTASAVAGPFDKLSGQLGFCSSPSKGE